MTKGIALPREQRDIHLPQQHRQPEVEVDIAGATVAKTGGAQAIQLCFSHWLAFGHFML